MAKEVGRRKVQYRNLAREKGQRKGRELGQRRGGNSEQERELGLGFRNQNVEMKQKVNCLGENSLTIGQEVLQDEDLGMMTI